MRAGRDGMRLRGIAAGLAFAACSFAHAQNLPTDPSDAHVTLSSKRAAPLQAGGNFVLKARLAPDDSALRTPVHEGGTFAMTGKLAAVPLICYSDTIFRDDFDGDGF